MITLLEIAGYAIIAGTVAHVATNLISNVRRTAREAELQRETLELFRQRAQILVEAGLAERERAELSWNGFRKFRIDQKELEAEGIRSFYLRPHDQKGKRSVRPWNRRHRNHHPHRIEVPQGGW